MAISTSSLVYYVEPKLDYLQATLTPNYTQAETRELSIEDMIRMTFKENAFEMLKIAECESNLNPRAIKKTKRELSIGIFQINTYAHKDLDPDLLYDPKYNIEEAYKIFKKDGLDPWQNCTIKKLKNPNKTI